MTRLAGYSASAWSRSPLRYAAQRRRQGVLQIGGQLQIVRVQNGRVVKGPLDDINGVEDGGFARGLPRSHGGLFAAGKLERTLLIGQIHRAVQQAVNSVWPSSRHDEVEFRAANGPGGGWRAKLRSFPAACRD